LDLKIDFAFFQRIAWFKVSLTSFKAMKLSEAANPAFWLHRG
jgi:hypothetical protein